MSHPSPAAPRHDPYWDVDGKGARRSRLQRRFVRWGVRIVAILVIVVLVTRLPAVDPAFLASPEGKPILGAAIMSLLAATVLLGLARMRHGSRN